MSSPAENITIMLNRLAQGEQHVLDQLMPVIYAEMKKLASQTLRKERSGHTLNTTALVHEAYLKLIDKKQLSFDSRGHFFGIAARAMRQILIDYARKHQASKRGDGQKKVPIDDVELLSPEQSEEILALEESLKKLESLDERKARIVELRYFTGLNIDETAEALQTSPATVKRDWNFARAWLFREMGGMATT